MKLPVGMLVYLVERFDADSAMIAGFWYYKEMELPSSASEKKCAIKDFEDQVSVGLMMYGSIDQIAELLLQGDRFRGAVRLDEYNVIIEVIRNGDEGKYLFDDVYALKGTALGLDVLVNIEEDSDFIFSNINRGNRGIQVNISPDWSYTKDLLKVLRGS